MNLLSLYRSCLVQPSSSLFHYNADYQREKHKKRRGSERDVDQGVVKLHAAKRQIHMSEPDQKGQVLLQLTQKTLKQLETGGWCNSYLFILVFCRVARGCFIYPIIILISKY